MRKVWVVAIMLLAMVSLCRADAWMLTTPDFLPQTVVLHTLDEHGAGVTAGPTQSAQTISLDRLLELSRIVPAKLHPSRFILRLKDGDLLAGEPVSLMGESIVWREDVVGNLTVPLKKAVGFHRAGMSEARSAGVAADDAVSLANGDLVHGVLSDLAETSISIQPAAGGDATSIPIGSVNSVQFAAMESEPATSQAGSAYPPAFRIHLADGSIFTAASAHGDEQSMHLSLEGWPAVDVPMASIESIEQVNGPVAWLSWLTPAKNVQTPFLEAERPARFDLNVMGGPIQFGDRTYTHGIGVHAYSQLSWAIPPGYVRFRTQYAVDGDLPYAQMTVRIKLDGEMVHQRIDLRAGEISPVVDLNLDGRRTLTLEVEDSQSEGVQARLNWIEPAFLRTAASATTAP